jgi:hypothetical protein
MLSCSSEKHSKLSRNLDSVAPNDQNDTLSSIKMTDSVIDVVEDKALNFTDFDLNETLSDWFGKKTYEIQFPLDHSKKPREIDWFKKNGLIDFSILNDDSVLIEPNRVSAHNYHLISWNYKNSKFAQEAMQDFLDSVVNPSLNVDHYDLPNDLRNKSVQYGVKAGGLVIRYQNRILYLLKSCSFVPVGETWEEFENGFLQHFKVGNDSLLYLNAYCGSDRFAIEYFKNK